MRRSILFILSLVLLVWCMVGCAEREPDSYLPETSVTALKDAINVLERVLSYDISIDDVDKHMRYCVLALPSDYDGERVTDYLVRGYIEDAAERVENARKLGNAESIVKEQIKELKEILYNYRGYIRKN